MHRTIHTSHGAAAGRSMCAQPVQAGPKGRFFDRPKGDKKESER